MEYKEIRELAIRLAALANPVRLDIVFILSELGEVSATDLMHEVEVSQPELSRHLRMLVAADVLVVRVAPPYKYYRLSDRALGHRLVDFWRKN